jgi:hypothetical protein
MKSVLATFVVMLAVIADSSCASSERTFPHAKWDRINQNAYDSAFETAIVWKFVRELEHLDYVTFITPARALIWTTYVNCEAPQIQTEWLIKPGVCALTVPARHPGGCINFYGCAVVKASPSMLSESDS